MGVLVNPRNTDAAAALRDAQFMVCFLSQPLNIAVRA
jgi:hypothetical protein